MMIKVKKYVVKQINFTKMKSLNHSINQSLSTKEFKLNNHEVV